VNDLQEKSDHGKKEQVEKAPYGESQEERGEKEAG
jgi:hypothetical protein